MATRKNKLQKGKSLVPLFELDTDGETLVINRDYVKGVYPFRDILSSDSTKDKKNAYKYFYYIYLMNDLNSELDGLGREEKHIKAKDLAGIEDVNFDRNKMVKDAEKVYVTLYESLNPQIKMYRTLKKGLNSADRTINKLIDRIETVLDKQDIIIANGKEGEALPEVSALVSDLNTLMSIAKGLPETINSMNNIYDSIKEENIEDSEVRGGGGVGSREDPSYIKEKFNKHKETDDV